MLISVVIPTTGRSSVARAVDSVLAQESDAQVEVIVVADGRDSRDRLGTSLHGNPRVSVVGTDQSRGAARSRNIGISHARGNAVAFLDDDDEWLPGKLQAQLRLLTQIAESGKPAVISCRVVQRGSAAVDADSAPVPKALIREADRVEDYLFRGRSPVVGRPSLFTSTLLVDSELARRVPWRDQLSRHQDWDWLIRLQDAGALIRSAEEIGARIFVNSSASISASSNWEASLNWVREASAEWDGRTRADFLTAQTLRYALQSRKGGAVGRVVWAIAANRRLPHFSCVLLGVGGLIDRRWLPKYLNFTGRQRNMPLSERAASETA